MLYVVSRQVAQGETLPVMMTSDLNLLELALKDLAIRPPEPGVHYLVMEYHAGGDKMLAALPEHERLWRTTRYGQGASSLPKASGDWRTWRQGMEAQRQREASAR